MQSFTYFVPTRVLFGRGTEAQAGEAVRAEGGSRVLVICGGGSARRSGLLDLFDEARPMFCMENGESSGNGA